MPGSDAVAGGMTLTEPGSGNHRVSCRIPALLLPLFVGSGFSALVYEIVWLQLLQLVIGSTAVSLGVLLGTFMGGMCAGSLLLPRIVSSRRHPLRVYALLELGIGAIAVAVLYGMPYVERLYAGAAGGGWAASLALRGVVSAVILVAPTILMGATLPAVSRGLGTTPEDVSWLGFLYGTNIAGAVAGCLVAGFYLLRTYDVVTATLVAAAVNLTVAAVALALSVRWPHRPAQDAPPQGAPPPPAGPVCVHIAIGLSGLTALGAEVVWTRLLSLLLGGTVYTFSIILAVFLLGLGIGSLIGSLVARSPWPRAALGCCQLLLAGAIAWTAWTLADSIPYWPLDPTLSTSPWATFQVDLVVCLWAVLPGAILWGASFPLALGAAAGPGQDPGRLVAGVYAANTVGAILGALGFSLVFVPVIGTQWSQRLLLAIAAASAALVLGPLVWSREGPPGLRPAHTAAARLSAIALAAAAVLVPLAAISVSPVPWAAVGFGRLCGTMMPEVYPGVLDQDEIELFRHADVWRIVLRIADGAVTYDSRVGGRPGQVLSAAIRSKVDAWIAEHESELLAALRKGRRPAGEAPSSSAVGGGTVTRYCSFLGEGVNVSVAISESDDGIRYFHGAGKVQASTDPADMRLQRMLGHLSMLTRGDPDSARSVLVVACGAGVTAGSFVPYKNLERIVICEIEPMVLTHVAPVFGLENNDVLDDPRTQVVVDDGRHFVRTTKEKFDVITSDPLDPWVKGCAALNTREYYEMCKAHLNPGGVMTVWVPLYESDLKTVRTSIATFFQVFPNGVIWSNDVEGQGYDVVLFGQADLVGKVNMDDLQAWLDQHPAVAESLEEVGFGPGRELEKGYGKVPELAVDLLATYAGRAPDMAQWLRDAQINTDRNLRLQYEAGMALNRSLSERLLREILAYYRFPAGLIEGSDARLAALEEQLEEAGRYPRGRIARRREPSEENAARAD